MYFLFSFVQLCNLTILEFSIYPRVNKGKLGIKTLVHKKTFTRNIYNCLPNILVPIL